MAILVGEKRKSNISAGWSSSTPPVFVFVGLVILDNCVSRAKPVQWVLSALLPLSYLKMFPVFALLPLSTVGSCQELAGDKRFLDRYVSLVVTSQIRSGSRTLGAADGNQIVENRRSVCRRLPRGSGSLPRV